MRYFRWRRKRIYLLLGAAMFFVTLIDLQLIHNNKTLSEFTYNSFVSDVSSDISLNKRSRQNHLQLKHISIVRSINEWKKANTKLRKSSVLNANVERNLSKIHKNAQLFTNNHGELRTFTEIYEEYRRLVNTYVNGRSRNITSVKQVSPIIHENRCCNASNSERKLQEQNNDRRKVSSLNIFKNRDSETSTNKIPHLMTVAGKGRLGNYMFQLGALIGISGYHGYTPQLSSSHTLRRVFKITLPITSFRNSETYLQKYAGIFDPEVLALQHDANWTLVGYFQSWKYFLNSTSELRAQLRFNDEILLDMQEAFPSFLISNRTTVGVHIRRGDMNTRYERNRGYSVAHLDYIHRAMRYYRDKYTNPTFVVCSDDIAWCKKHLVSNDTSFVHVSAEVDLAVLAHCTHNVITSGSYGWWGAFLAGGETVYYKNFPRRRSWLETQYKREDYYLPHWVGLD